MRQAFVGSLLTVPHGDDPVGRLRHLHVMGDEDHRVPLLAMHLLEQRHDLVRVLAVEISRGLVGQQDARIVRKTPRDRHSLALAAGEFCRQMIEPVGHAHGLQQFACTPLALTHRPGRFKHGHLHVFQGGQRRQQVEALEDEANVLRTKSCRVRQARHRLASKADLPAIRRVECAQQVEQRGLPAAAGADDGNELPLVNLQADAAQGKHMPAVELTMHILDFEEHGGAGTGWSSRCGHGRGAKPHI